MIGNENKKTEKKNKMESPQTPAEWNNFYKKCKSNNIELHPEILSHPNIPKPLHGVCPRNFKGKDWWEEIRQKAYASTNYHCLACGIHKSEAKKHQWLEAHEYWIINYETGICEITSIVPLCHYCHNFIHSGRLAMILGKEKSVVEVKEILEHGFKILAANNLKAFVSTLLLAYRIEAYTHNVTEDEPLLKMAKWGDFKLIFEGKEYKPKFKSYEEWESFYKK